MSGQAIIQAHEKKAFLSGDSSFFLDLIRVIACEMVVLCHILGVYLLARNLEGLDNFVLWKTIEFLAEAGVMLFFFVSGIVIANSVFSKVSKGKYSFSGYFIDRFSRIYSGLVPALILIFILNLLIMSINSRLYLSIGPRFGGGDMTGGVFLASLAMLQSLPPLYVPQPHFGEALWTLNIEWWLYMLFGWMAIGARRILKPDWKTILVLFVFSLVPAYELLFAPDGRGSLVAVWFFGMLIAILMIRSKYAGFIRKHFRFLFGLAFLLTAARIAQIYLWNLRFYDIVLEVLAGCLILVVVINYNGQSSLQVGRLKNLVKGMARYSFTLYLLNMALIGLIMAVDGSQGLHLPFAVILPISLLFTNLAALGIASVTEMRYKGLSGWIKGKINGVRPLQAQEQARL